MEGSTSTLRFVRQVGSHKFPIVSCAYNSQHHHILTCDQESLRLWSFRKELRKISLTQPSQPSKPPILFIKYNPNLDFYILIAAGSWQPPHKGSRSQTPCSASDILPGSILTLGPSLLPLTPPVSTGSQFEVVEVAFVGESQELALLCGGGEVVVWRFLRQGSQTYLHQKCTIITSDAHNAMCADFSGSGALFTAGTDDTFHVLDTKKGGIDAAVAFPNDTSGNVLSMSYLHTTRTLLLGTSRGLILAYASNPLPSGGTKFQLLSRYTQHGSAVRCITYNADLFGAVSCGEDNVVLHSDVVSGEELGRHQHRHQEPPSSHVPSNSSLAHPQTRFLLFISVEINGSKRQYLLVTYGELVTILRVYSPFTTMYTCTSPLLYLQPVWGVSSEEDLRSQRESFIGEHHLVGRHGARTIRILDAASGEVQHEVEASGEATKEWISHYTWYDSIERHFVGWSNGAASLLDNHGTTTWHSPNDNRVGAISASHVVHLSSDDYLLIFGTTEGHLCKANLSGAATVKAHASHCSRIIRIITSNESNTFVFTAERLGSVKVWTEDCNALLAVYQAGARFTISAMYQSASVVVLGLGSGRLQTLCWNREDSLELQEDVAAHGDAVSSVEGFQRDGKVILSASIDKTLLLWRFDGNSLLLMRSIHTNHSIRGAFFSPVRNEIVVHSVSSVSYLSNWQVYAESCNIPLSILLDPPSATSEYTLEGHPLAETGKEESKDEKGENGQGVLSGIQIKVLTLAFKSSAAEFCKYTDNPKACIPFHAAVPLLKTLGYREISTEEVTALLKRKGYPMLEEVDLMSFIEIAEMYVSANPPVVQSSTQDAVRKKRTASGGRKRAKRNGVIGQERVVVEWNEMGEKRISRRSLLPIPPQRRQSMPSRPAKSKNGYVAAREAAMRMVKASRGSGLEGMEWPTEVLRVATAESVCRKILWWRAKAGLQSSLSECVYLYHLARHGQLCEEMVAKKIEAFLTSLCAAPNSPLCRCILFLLGMGPPPSRAPVLLQHAHSLFFSMYNKLHQHLGKFCPGDKARQVNLSVFLQAAAEGCQVYTSQKLEHLEEWIQERVLQQQVMFGVNNHLPVHKRAIDLEEGLEVVLTLWLQALQARFFFLPGSRARPFISTAESTQNYSSMLVDVSQMHSEEDVWIPSVQLQLEEESWIEGLNQGMEAEKTISLACKEDYPVDCELRDRILHRARPHTCEVGSGFKSLERSKVAEESEKKRPRRMSRVPSVVGIQAVEAEEEVSFGRRRRSISRRGSTGSAHSLSVGPLECEDRDEVMAPKETPAASVEEHQSTLSSLVDVPKVETMSGSTVKAGASLEEAGNPPTVLPAEMSLLSSGVLEESIEIKPQQLREATEQGMEDPVELLRSSASESLAPMLTRPMTVEGETADDIFADAEFQQTQEFVDNIFETLDQQANVETSLLEEAALLQPETPTFQEQQRHSIIHTPAPDRTTEEQANTKQSLPVSARTGQDAAGTVPAPVSKRPSKFIAANSKSYAHQESTEPAEIASGEQGRQDRFAHNPGNRDFYKGGEVDGKAAKVDARVPSTETWSMNNATSPQFLDDSEEVKSQVILSAAASLGDEGTPAEEPEETRNSYIQHPTPIGSKETLQENTREVVSSVDTSEDQRQSTKSSFNEHPYLPPQPQGQIQSTSTDVCLQSSLEHEYPKGLSDGQDKNQTEPVATDWQEKQSSSKVGQDNPPFPASTLTARSLPQQASASRLTDKGPSNGNVRTVSAQKIQRWFRETTRREGRRESQTDGDSMWSGDDNGGISSKESPSVMPMSVLSNGEVETVPCAFGDPIRFIPLDLMKTRFSMPHWEAKEAIESDSESESDEDHPSDGSGDPPCKAKPVPLPSANPSVSKEEPLPTIDLVISALKNWKKYFVEVEQSMFGSSSSAQATSQSSSNTAPALEEVKSHLKGLKEHHRHPRNAPGECKDWRVSRKERLSRVATGEITLEQLEKGLERPGYVGKGSFAYYTFSHGSPKELLSVKLVVSSGVVDMFLSKHSLPTFADFCAKSSARALERTHTIVLSGYHEDNVKGNYFIGVFGISQAEFQVVVESIEAPQSQTLRNVQALTDKFRDLSPESACISLQPPVVLRPQKDPEKEKNSVLQEQVNLEELSHDLSARDKDAAQFIFWHEAKDDSLFSRAEAEGCPESEPSLSPRTSSEPRPRSEEDSFSDPYGRFVTLNTEVSSDCSSITDVTEAANSDLPLQKNRFKLFRSVASYLSTPSTVFYKLRSAKDHARKKRYTIPDPPPTGYNSTPLSRARHKRELPPLREERKDEHKVLLGIGFEKFKEIPEERPIPDLSLIYRKSPQELAAARKKSALRASARLKKLQQKSVIEQKQA